MAQQKKTLVSDSMHVPISVLVDGKDAANSWAREINLIMVQPEILAGEDFKGNAKMTRDLNVLMVLDEAAVEEIVAGVVHPGFESGKYALIAYDREFTYDYVREQNCAPEKYQFVYNYMHRLTDYPLPTRYYVYQGKSVAPFIDAESAASYFTANNGFDQVKWLHDAIRKDGISRRHQMITWIPIIDDFSANPPCLQRLWVRVLVPKSQWKNYPGCIPVEVHIDYRSWDIARAQPSNLYGLTRMLYRYVFGNLTPDTEYVTEAGEPVKHGDIVVDDNGVLHNKSKFGSVVKLNDVGNVIEFKCVKIGCYGDAAHVYEDAYNRAKLIKPVRGAPRGV